MTDYDFKTLNDKEFEVLATDLLSKRDGVKYERFKPGRDRGVDGRYFMRHGKEIILQCKHWISTPLEKLIKNLAENELPKIKALNPEKYILVLSHPLSRNDKDVILKKLSPYIKTPSDILGREDLNDILALNEDIERRHYKLWITSSNILNSLLNKPIHGRSESLLEDIKSNSYMYVETENHNRALEKLEYLGTVIITGPAGIGKTTLAEQLLLYYTSLGYSLHSISKDINEAESVFNIDENQIFFFDDFLGRNYLEALSGHEGSHIVNFIKRIKKNKKKKFILTSRTTILNQGKILNDVFHNNNLQRNEFEISFESFSPLDKAKILYNHIWHSSLSKDHVDQLYLNKRYKEIINHKNYNPRIIKFITDSERLDECDHSQYWNYCKDRLDNPADVWRHPFEAQHDDFGRALILLVTLNSREIDQAALAEAYSRLLSLPYAFNMDGKKDYLQQLRHLVGSMLNRTLMKDGRSLINLFNPSIGDFVLKRYPSDIPALRSTFTCLRSVSSIKTVLDLHKNNLISIQARNEILESIIKTAHSLNYVGYDAEYISIAILNYYSNLDRPEFRSIIDSASNFIINSSCPENFNSSLKLIKWRLKHSLSSDEEIYEYLINCINSGVNSNEASNISDIIRELPDELLLSALDSLEIAYFEYLKDNIYEEFDDSDVFHNTTPSNIKYAVDNLWELIQEKFREIDIHVSDTNAEKIIEAYDIENRSENYFSDSEEVYFYREKISTTSAFDEIEDLFERT